MSKESIKKMKNYLSFILTLVAVLGSLALGWFKGVNLDFLLPSLVGIYVLGRVAEKSNTAWAVAKDPNANAGDLIDKTYK